MNSEDIIVRISVFSESLDEAKEEAIHAQKLANANVRLNQPGMRMHDHFVEEQLVLTATAIENLCDALQALARVAAYTGD